MQVISDAGKGRVVGDVCFEEAVKVASKITPVPGGMGHISFAILLRNVLNLARSAAQLTRIGIGPSGHEMFRCADRLSFPDIGLKVPRVLIPRKGVDFTKWCVIACDQYTSQPEYWKSVKNLVKDEPSTLNLIFPEVYLSDAKSNQRIIRGIKDKMYEYDRDRILEPQHPGFVLLDRKTPHVASRKGVLAALESLDVRNLSTVTYMSAPVPQSRSKIDLNSDWSSQYGVLLVSCDWRWYGDFCSQDCL